MFARRWSKCIALRLEADVPVACYLSGGIDSCSILGMAAAIQQSPVKAFTIGFDDARYDEASIATEMAEMVGADQDILRVSAADLYGKNFEDAVYYSERTFYNTLGVAKMLMSRHVTAISATRWSSPARARRAVRRLCPVQGRLFPPRSRLCRQARAGAEMKKRNKIFSGSRAGRGDDQPPRVRGSDGLHPQLDPALDAGLERVKPLLSDEFVAKLDDYDPIAAIAYSLDKSMLDGRHVLDKVQYSWIKTMLEGQILNWGGDRVDMANSLESRPAFLDHHVAELAMRIPPHRPHPRRDREMGRARGDEARASRSALQAREIRLHGAARAHRRGEGPLRSTS